jgi:single-strand DNA-binding protein
MNKVIIIGNLGRDPETRQSQSGMAVARLSVATTYKPREGEPQTEWHRVVVFGRQAESCERYLAKGSSVAVEGRLKTSAYEKDGVKRYSTDIVADRVQFLGGRQRREDGASGDYTHGQTPAAYTGDLGDDDIPF